MFRLAAARRHHLGRAAPGAFTVAVLWQGLQYVGTQYTTRVLAETEGMNFVFALVLGLIGIIYVAALMGVIGIEVNVVLARRLWPRSLRTLFVDRGELTDADRRAYASYVARPAAQAGRDRRGQLQGPRDRRAPDRRGAGAEGQDAALTPDSGVVVRQLAQRADHEPIGPSQTQTPWPSSSLSMPTSLCSVAARSQPVKSTAGSP